MAHINLFHWSSIDDASRQKILRRSQATIDDIIPVVQPILENVRLRGDAALRDYAMRFEKAELGTLKVSEEEFTIAEQNLAPEIKAAIDHCVKNICVFHQAQMSRVDSDWMIEVEPGIFAGEKVTPISSVGLYVPSGKNAFPSAMYMLCVPAVLAGVPQISVVTPCRSDGTINPASLYAARISGVTNIYKSGGAQAIAALAYGTETIPKVAKVLGPGSAYVAAAKLLLSSQIDPGMPAGPSESITLCDGTADIYNTVLDLLNEAEHGPDSAALLITHDENFARAVADALPDAIAQIPQPQQGWLKTVFLNFGAIIVTDSIEQSIEVANLYAPEHLLLKVQNPDEILPQLTNAGEILIGDYSSFSLGNYGIGVNHVLPTGGFAHSYSCTSVWDFLKRTSLSRVTREGFQNLAPHVARLTEYEGFPAHTDALLKRKI